MLEGLPAAVARIDYSKAKTEARLFQNRGADDADGFDSAVRWRCKFEGRSNRIHWLTGWGWGMGVRARGMSGRTHKIFSPINEDGIVIYCDGEHWRMSRGSSFWF